LLPDILGEYSRAAEGEAIAGRQRRMLGAEAVEEPEDEAEDCAEQDAGDDGEGEGPVAATEGDVSGETAEGDVEAAEADNQQACDKEDRAGDDKEATEVGHGDWLWVEG